RLVPGISLVTAEMTAGVEQLIDDLVAERPPRPVFVVPGATQAGAMLDLARAVVRRAERHAVRARSCRHPVANEVLCYLNRLSDLLFVLARHAAGDAAEPASHD
ncbi:MAG TPA: ATP:cob(I)alamin adenosyltransferase, partial [Trebonia sp.]